MYVLRIKSGKEEKGQKIVIVSQNTETVQDIVKDAAAGKTLIMLDTLIIREANKMNVIRNILGDVCSKNKEMKYA